MRTDGDYISREAAIDDISSRLNLTDLEWNPVSLKNIRAYVAELINHVPAADAIEKMPRWIPVTERLPEKAGHYIVFVELKRNGQKISAWTQVTWFFGDFLLECPEDEERFVAAVTHWMPLPKPPKEDA